MSTLESSLIGLLLKATLIIAIALAMHFALRRASAATRHLSLTMAMLGLVLLPFLALGLPVWQLEVLPPNAPAPSSETSPELLDEEWLAAGAPTLPPPGSTGKFDSSQVDAGTGDGARLGLAGWLVVAWFLGSALVLAKLTVGVLRMRWVVRRAERVTDPQLLRQLDACIETLHLRARPWLASSGSVGVPLVWGWLRPTMIVPREFVDWPAGRVRAVMLHELGHLKRIDWPILLLGRVAAALYWFHPLVWFLERHVKQECERACDDIVVAYGTKPSDYASHLLSIARRVSETPACVKAALAVVRRSQMSNRLRSILDPLLSRNTPSRTAVTALGTVLLMVLVPLASVQLAERAYADEPQEDADVLLAQYKRQQMQAEHDGEASEGKRAFERGYKLHEKGLYDEAAQAFEEAIDLEFQPATAMYNIACCHALMDDTGAAMSWLEKAAQAGFDTTMSLIKDSDFHPIRSDNRFQEFIDQTFELAGIERSFPDHYPYRLAMENLQKLKETGSTHGKKWFHVGNELLGMREFDLASDAYAKAVEYMEGNRSTAMYNLACSYSLAGKTGPALDWLDRSLEAGFDNHKLLLDDSDLENIRDDARFSSIKEKSEFLSLGRFPRRDWENSNYSKERWAQAIEEYRDYVGDHPSSGRGWHNLGWALHHSEHFEEAVGAFEKAAALDFQPGRAQYNLACGYAMLNRTDAALDALEFAVESGTIHHGHLEGDSDLDNLRDEPRFQALLERLEAEKKREHAKKMEMKMKMKMKDKEKEAQKQTEAKLRDE
jgi:beta-lactamase regulating signal transducer with metallopeptidase domain/Tfp pilus assembly protein PilF